MHLGVYEANVDGVTPLKMARLRGEGALLEVIGMFASHTFSVLRALYFIPILRRTAVLLPIPHIFKFLRIYLFRFWARIEP